MRVQCPGWQAESMGAAAPPGYEGDFNSVVMGPCPGYLVDADRGLLGVLRHILSKHADSGTG